MNLKVSLSLLIVSFHVGTSQNVENNGNHFGNKDGTTADAGTSTALPDVPPEAICLFNSDFEQGTMLIDSSGKYKLCEDIIFDPPMGGGSPAEGYDPDLDIFDSNAYGLGFFAALAITASDVELYLNAHSIQQSAGHALLQRFFAVIELNNAPFNKNVGPAQFVGDGSTFQSASNVLIQGPGIIGRSAHHGIHGNNNVNVVIRDVTFEDFEVAAVALNNADNAIITGNTITRNRHDVPILGSFSAARQIRQYGKVLKEKQFSMDIKGVTITAADVYATLVSYINNVYTDVVENGGFINEAAHPDEHYLFDNPKRVIDGPCYAFVVHGKGPAVGGFGFAQAATDSMSSFISITNNAIENIKCWTNEVPAAVVEGVVQNDARGAVLQFVKSTDPNGFLAINSDGTYRRNPVADMQMMTAHAIQTRVLTSSAALQTIVNTISPSLVAWAQSVDAVFHPEYRCNGDSMHHTVKGMVVIRIDDTAGFEVDSNTINNVQNLSEHPFDNCSTYQAGASVEDAEVQQAGNIRMISASASTGYPTNGNKGSRIVSNTITNASSESGTEVIGIDIQGDTDSTRINFNTVDLAKGAGTSPDDQYISLRVRSFAESSGSQTIHVGSGNEFAQEMQILNRRLGDKSRRARFLEAHKRENQNMGNEWNLGGCPFANNFAA